MQTMNILKTYIYCLVFIFCVSTYADQGISSAEIEARVAELSALSVRSVSGNFIVIGTNRVENFALGGWCENAAKQIEQMTGLPVPFDNYRVNLVVGQDNKGVPSGAVVRYSRNGQKKSSRVYLENYDGAYKRRGRQAICCAILAGYADLSLGERVFMSPWFWKGLEQNILFDVRSRNMEQVLADWRAGKLMSVWDIVGRGNLGQLDKRAEMVESQEKLATYSVFVRWLSSLPNKKEIFRTIFDGSEYISVSGLEDLIVDDDSGMSLDEEWDRWLLRQSRVVRSYAGISTRIIEQLRSELLLYPGTYGIPLACEIPQGSPLVWLIKFRDAEWISQYINRKRGRLNLIVAGYDGDLLRVVGLFDEFFSSLEKDVPDVLLLKRLREAKRALTALAEDVGE